MQTMQPPTRTPRAVPTTVFAAYLGEQIADQRGTSSIPDTFCAALRQHNVPVQGAAQLAAWANCVSKLILADTCHDNEPAMAVRAVLTVLKQYLGDTITLDGPWIPDETLTVKGKVFRLTGQHCPSCGTSPESQGIGYSTTRCMDTQGCGWSQTAF